MPNLDFRKLIDPSRLFGAAQPAKPAAPAQPAQAPAAAAPAQTRLDPVDQSRVSRRGTSQTTAPLVHNGQPAAVAFPDRAAASPARPAASPAAPAPARAAAPVQAAAPVVRAPMAVDNRATFFDGNAATGQEIDGVLKHYGSPHAGQGELIARICQEENINPILMISVMQQESSYGNRNNRPSLKGENIANPWSVHFDERAKGINKLRLPSNAPPNANGERPPGPLPTFEQSLRGAIRTMKNLAGSSETPLTKAGERYSETGTWSVEVGKHFDTQRFRIAGFRAPN